MHCAVCKHIKDIRATLKPCASCKTRRCEGCAVLAKFRRIDRYCENCDAGRLNGTVHYDGVAGGLAGVLAHNQAAEEATAAPDAGGVTMLAQDTEDALRIALADLMSLDPMELLLVRHAFQGRPLAKVRETLRKVRDRLNRLDLRDADDSGKAPTSFKALVSHWAKQIVAKVPALGDVFEAVKAETAGCVK